MIQDVQQSILALCVEIDSIAHRIYSTMKSTEKDDALASLWSDLANDEADHVRFWKLLIDHQKKGIIPHLFDDPMPVYDKLAIALERVRGLPQMLGEKASTQRKLVVASIMEMHFLDQTLLELLRYVETVDGTEQPLDKYNSHLNRFLSALREYGATLELKIIGENLARLWEDNKTLFHRSYVDPLTGLLNRRGFFGTIVPLANLAKRNGFRIALAMVDVDNFKALNDTRGHQVGDAVLRFVGEVIRGAIRGSDVAARYGGEEFVIYLSAVHEQHIDSIGEKVRAAIERESRGKVPVTVSVGLASGLLSHNENAEARIDELIAQADANLYRAKESGKNRVAM